MTGRAGGIPLSDELKQQLSAAELPAQAPTRGANASAGGSTVPGTLIANVEQQKFFADVATEAVLPIFKARKKLFVLVFGSRDPDGTQHNQGDSLGRLMPGINGPTSLASIKNADDNLAELLASLKKLGLDRDTDVIITSDHGFSTISKEGATSWAASQTYKNVPAHLLPAGFVSIDIARSLGMNLYDPDAKGAPVPAGSYPSKGNGLIGDDAAHPQVVSPRTAAPTSHTCRRATRLSPRRWSPHCRRRITSAGCSWMISSAGFPGHCRGPRLHSTVRRLPPCLPTS